MSGPNIEELTIHRIGGTHHVEHLATAADLQKADLQTELLRQNPSPLIRRQRSDEMPNRQIFVVGTEGRPAPGLLSALFETSIGALARETDLDVIEISPCGDEGEIST